MKFELLDEAEEWLTRSLKTYQDVLARLIPDDNETRTGVAKTLQSLGWRLIRLGRPEDAADHLTQAVTFRRALADHLPDDHEAQMDLADTLMLLAGNNDELGRLADAVDPLTRAVGIVQLLADLNPGNHEPKLITMLKCLEEWLRRLGRTDEADMAIARANDLAHRFPDPDTPDQP